MRDFIAGLPAPPDFPVPRGIVICGGGKRLFTSAWVCIRMLRHVGCRLPIQLWHLGDFEVDEQMAALVEAFGVECIDARAVAERYPVRILNGWELKAFAILHSPFAHAILLDADNVPLRDPEFLFDTDPYREQGAIFWPDYGRFAHDRAAWKVFGVAYRDEPEFESGQIVLDKQRCFAPLSLAVHFGEYSDYYFVYVHGDKDLFRMAFRRLGIDYAMPPFPIHPLDATMCQHDFDGNRLFQHRNMDKWRLDGSNRRIEGFREEALCQEFLAELNGKWSGEILWNALPTADERAVIEELAGSIVHYERVGYDSRELELAADRTVGRGAAAMERRWTILHCGGEPALVIQGDDGPTCKLAQHGRAWRGEWFKYERMPIEVTVKSARPLPVD